MNLSRLTLAKNYAEIISSILQLVSPETLQIQQLHEMTTMHGSYAHSKSQLPSGF